MLFSRKKPEPPPSEIDGVKVRVSARARRYSLRVSLKDNDVVLVLPKRARVDGARKFLRENMPWVEKQRSQIARPLFFEDGAFIDVYGKRLQIKAMPGRGATRIEGDFLIVHGDARHHHRRLRDFLKEEARKILEQKSREKAAQTGARVGQVRISDPVTRWGSCSAEKTLSFSWRVILAPPFVLDYLVAHEVAHLTHMNHGRNFWKLCASLTQDAKGARKWLRAQGNDLHRYK